MKGNEWECHRSSGLHNYNITLRNKPSIGGPRRQIDEHISLQTAILWVKVIYIICPKKGYAKQEGKTGRLQNCYITLLKRSRLVGPKRLDY